MKSSCFLARPALLLPLVVLLLTAMALPQCRGRRYRGGENTRSFEFLFEGRERSYELYVPESARPNPDVLFVLHGGGGNPARMMSLTYGAFDRLADAHGFLVVYPAGVDEQWNDGREVPNSEAHEQKINDAGFLLAIQDRLRADFGASKTYFTGISNGGFMSFRMGCEHSDRVDGVAPITANISVFLSSRCRPTRVPILVINGTEDPLVPYDGGFVKVLGRERGQIISTDDSIRLWLSHNGCAAPADFEASETKALDSQDDGTVARRFRFPCSTPVELIRIEGGGHTWPRGLPYLPEFMVGRVSQEIDASAEVVNFFGLN